MTTAIRSTSISFARSATKWSSSNIPDLDEVLRDVCRQHQFSDSQGHSFVIRGICGDCNRARMTKRRLDLV